MVRALDYNETLEQREFEPWLRMSGFFSKSTLFFISFYYCNIVDTYYYHKYQLLFSIIE